MMAETKPKKTIYAKLTAIQSELNAPKNQYNSFGKYNYRNCEDIEAALKPLLASHKCALIVTDELVSSNKDSFKGYIKATVKFWDSESGDCIECDGYAAEPMMRKGMDDSQITGASSSYARKYALGGMFLIDDNKDADSQDNKDSGKPSKPEQKPESDSMKKFREVFGEYVTKHKSDGVTGASLKADIEEMFGVISGLTDGELENAISYLRERDDVVVMDEDIEF